MLAGEPSGPIQLIPPGLLGLLQVKSPAGQNPNVLNADVQPNIDMLPWWLRANRQVWPSNSGITVGPGGSGVFTGFSPNNMTVPQNQWWYVHSLNIAVLCQATCVVNAVRPAMQWNDTGTLRYRGIGTDETIVFMDSTYGSKLLCAYDFWVPPGAELGIYAGQIAVADLQVDVRGMDYTICPI